MWVAYYLEGDNSLEGPKGHKYFKSEKQAEAFLITKAHKAWYQNWTMEEIEFEDDKE